MRGFPTRIQKILPLLLAALTFLLAPACGKENRGGAGVTRLTVWFHTGKPAEREVMEALVRRFNGRDPSVQADLVLIPEDGYHTQVEAQAAGGTLPDVLDFDGPFLANYAWKGYLVPIEDLLGADVVAGLLPSIKAQGRYEGRLYGAGSFDSGLGLYGLRSRLEEAGLRIPGYAADAWSINEFDEALAELAKRERAAGGDGQVLDLKLNYSGEWFTYAFSPCLQSAGGDLVTRTGLPIAQGSLDSKESRTALGRIRAWIEAGRIDPNVDDRAFVSGRVALSWSGHWDYPRYAEAHGKDLCVLPLPDFGHGTRTGQGSWCWGITRDCPHPEKAGRFLRFLLEKHQVLAVCAANGAVPATRAAIAESPLYGDGKPLQLFAELLDGWALPRPVTPAYPVITDAFQRVFQTVRTGGDIAKALEEAAHQIDRDIADNEGYAVR